jgi:hypothetical protein
VDSTRVPAPLGEVRGALERQPPHLSAAPWPDQVKRRDRFTRAHPQVRFEDKTWPGPHCEAHWVKDDGTAGFVSDVWLEHLLDTLEAMQW